MEQDQEIQWWLGHFGRFGRVVHELTRDSVFNAHEEHANAQAQITAPHRRAYGSVNFSAQYFFEEGLKRHADIIFVQPRPGVPKLPVVNGKVVVLWRYANRDGIDVFLKKFATSSSRSATFNIKVAPSQPTLDFEVENELQLTEEDKEFLARLESAVSAEQATGSHYPVVVVAYASNAAGIYRAVGADACLQDDGTLGLTDVHPVSAARHKAAKGASDETKRFDRAPRKPLKVESKTGNEK